MTNTWSTQGSHARGLVVACQDKQVTDHLLWLGGILFPYWYAPTLVILRYEMILGKDDAQKMHFVTLDIKFLLYQCGVFLCAHVRVPR